MSVIEIPMSGLNHKEHEEHEEAAEVFFVGVVTGVVLRAVLSVWFIVCARGIIWVQGW